MPSCRALVLWIALSQLVGCTGEGEAARGDISSIAVGMTQAQVLATVGQPQRREAYGPTEFLFYTSSYGVDVPIAIVDGKVTSMGQAAYNIVVRSRAQIDTTGANPARRQSP